MVPIVGHRLLGQSGNKAGNKARQKRRNRRLLMESLEDRCLLSAAGLEFGALVADPEAYAEDRVIVRFREGAQLPPGVVANQIMASLNMWSVALGNGQTVAQQLAALRNLPEVLYAQPDYQVSVQDWHETDTPWDDPIDDMIYKCGLLWGLNNNGSYEGTVDADIDAPAAWHTSMGSSSVVVAVIDTGVDYSHPDLQQNMWINANEIAANGLDDDGNGYVDDVYGYDFHNNDSDPMDDQGHGSHVAGTIAAAANNNAGAACDSSQGKGLIGVAPNSRIMALKFLDDRGSGYGSNAIRALDYAVGNGVRVSNNSYGGGSYDQAMADAIQRAANANHLFVAAAGNGDWFGRGIDNDSTPFYPASYQPTPDIVVAVAASTSSDTYASFSNYGATSVDLAAPGVHIWSAVPYAKDTSDGTNDGYSRKDGTSMAAPHVAGAAALIMAIDPTRSALDIKQLLINTVDPISGRDTVSDGRLNVGKAAAATDAKPSVTIDQPLDGALVQGITTISATATDDKGVLQVEFLKDSVTIAIDTNGSDGWSAVWDFSAESEGSHQLQAKATDTRGQIASDTISVLVDNIDDPPTVKLTAPAAGSYVSGEVAISASAADDKGLMQVEFFVDGISLGIDSVGTDGWSVSWNTSGWEGTRTITATATDSGGTSASDSVADVRVDNTRPSVSIIQPSAGATITGVTTVEAQATDNSGVKQVEFFVDGVAIGVDSNGSDGWSVSWDSSVVANGSHTITSEATDVAENGAPSDPVAFNTANIVLIAQDGFESGSYSGGTGWASSWTRSGDAELRSDESPAEGNYHVRLRRSNGYLTRPADLSSWSDVTLTFWARADSFEGKDEAWVKVSPDGSSWRTVKTFDATYSGAGYNEYQVSLLASEMTAQFQLAFDAQMSNPADRWYIDLVQLKGVQSGSGSTLLGSGLGSLPTMEAGLSSSTATTLSQPARPESNLSGSLEILAAQRVTMPDPPPAPAAVDYIFEQISGNQYRHWAALEEALQELLGNVH